MKKYGLLGLLTVLLLSACTRIGPGYVGLAVNLAGGDRGKSKVEAIYGWEAYNPISTTIVKINTRNQHYISDQPITVQARGGTNVIVHPSFNYHVNGGSVDSLYLVWGVTSDQQIEGKLLEATLLTTMRETTNGWTIDSLLNYRGIYDQALEMAMDKKLSPYATLFQFTSGVTPDPSMAAAIADKAGSIQRAQAAEYKQRETQALANLEIITARKDSSVIVINALAEAKAITVKQEALKQSPQYVDLVKAQKWNGVLPSTMAGGQGMFLNIK